MFEPVNALERLLIAAATDPDARDAFIQAFLTSEVFISPAGDPPADGARATSSSLTSRTERRRRPDCPGASR